MMSLLRKIGLGGRAGMHPAAAAAPAYYEVWGGLESANRALWAAVWLASTVALLALILLRAQANRPPVVIRVSDAGQALAGTAGEPVPVSRAEIQNFIALFERFFTGFGVYTYEEDLRLAFSMMTPEFRRKADELLQRQGLVESVKAERLKTQVFLTELQVERDTPEHIACRIKGYREVGSYEAGSPVREVVFEHELMLKKVPRSATSPYGVLVEDYAESIYKK